MGQFQVPLAKMRSAILVSQLLFVSLAAAQFTFFGGRPSSFRRPQPQRFQPQQFRGGRFFSSFGSPPSSANSAAVSSPAASASFGKGNYEWNGKRFLLTWRTGRNNFAWNEGVSYCRSQGMKLISLDSREKADHFLNLVGKERAEYFWAGGEVSSDSQTLTWQNGRTESISKGQHPWSFTGRTGPQPDGGERCLAILNNVYRDGVKFHDVACHHRKPVVCEE